MSESKSYRKCVFSPNIPKPKAPYSQAVIANSNVYVSGLIGLDPSTDQLVTGGIQAETRQVLDNLGEVLKAAGTQYKNVVKVTILLKDIKDWPEVNSIYAQYFVEHLPARCAYQVGALPLGASLEIEAVALTGEVIDIKSDQDIQPSSTAKKNTFFVSNI